MRLVSYGSSDSVIFEEVDGGKLLGARPLPEYNDNLFNNNNNQLILMMAMGIKKDVLIFLSIVPDVT